MNKNAQKIASQLPDSACSIINDLTKDVIADISSVFARHEDSYKSKYGVIFNDSGNMFIPLGDKKHFLEIFVETYAHLYERQMNSTTLRGVPGCVTVDYFDLSIATSRMSVLNKVKSFENQKEKLLQKKEKLEKELKDLEQELAEQE